MYSSIIIIIKLFVDQYNRVTSILFKRLLKLLSYVSCFNASRFVELTSKIRLEYLYHEDYRLLIFAVVNPLGIVVWPKSIDELANTLRCCSLSIVKMKLYFINSYLFFSHWN